MIGVSDTNTEKESGIMMTNYVQYQIPVPIVNSLLTNEQVTSEIGASDTRNSGIMMANYMS